MPGRLSEHPAEVLFTDFGDFSVELVVRIWARYRSNVEWLQVRSDLVMAVYRAYREAGVVIPFPTRTLQLEDKLPPAVPPEDGSAG